MSAFAGEAVFVGLKEGLKLSLCAALVLGVLKREGFSHARGSLVAGIGIISLASLAVMTRQITPEMREFIVRSVGYVFGLFYFFSLGALFHSTGTDLLGPVKGLLRNRSIVSILVFLLTLIYAFPDMIGTSLYVADLAAMAGAVGETVGAAVIGFLVIIGFFALGTRLVKIDASGMFGMPQVLLALALVKLVAGGVRGFAEFSLIPSVQGGIMKLIHDMIHQLFVFFLVPDHPILSTTTWNFIGFLFGEAFGVWLALIVLVAPLFLFIRKHFTAAIEVPGESGRKAVRRKIIKAIRDQRVLKSIPIFLFMLFIVSIWFMEKGESTSRLFDPEPVPLVAEDGAVVVPISSPGSDLRDGMLHKYSVGIDGESVRIMIIAKADGKITVCLDACEICPPDGYAQGEKHVVCLYCNTPIPVDSLGQPGGCNPIPLRARVTETEVRIGMEEIAEAWRKVKTGETREGVRR